MAKDYAAMYAALKTALAATAYASLSAADAVALDAQGDAGNPVLKPFGFTDVLGCLSSASVVNIRGLPTATVLIEKINEQDRAGITHWIGALLASPPLITSGEAAAVAAVLAATVPGPGPLTVAFGVAPTVGDINLARSLS